MEKVLLAPKRKVSCSTTCRNVAAATKIQEPPARNAEFNAKVRICIVPTLSKRHEELSPKLYWRHLFLIRAVMQFQLFGWQLSSRGTVSWRSCAHGPPPSRADGRAGPHMVSVARIITPSLQLEITVDCIRLARIRHSILGVIK